MDGLPSQTRRSTTKCRHTTYAYDDLNHLEELETKDDDDDDLLFTQEYTLANNGQRTSVLEKRYDGTSGTPVSTVKTTWAYDALNRLTTETRDVGDNGQDGSDYVDTYAFDLAGNRVLKVRDSAASADDEITTSEFNDRDQLVKVETDVDEDEIIDSTVTYAYDANGSTTSVTTNDGAPVTKQYQWDLRNRMVGLDVDGNGEFDDPDDVIFAYDHEGTRVYKEEIGGDEVFYLQDKNNPTGYSQIIEEKDTNDDPLVSYIIGLDVIGQQYDAGDIEFLGYVGHGSVCHAYGRASREYTRSK